MKLLLDTHAFIWWDDNYSKLPEPLLKALRNPSNPVFLSLVSIWEMQIKTQLAKLKFSIPLPQKVENQQAKNKVQLLSITKSHIYALDMLPHHHRDPFDRLLIAQAQSDDLILVTHDIQIHQYDVTIFWETPPAS